MTGTTIPEVPPSPVGVIAAGIAPELSEPRRGKADENGDGGDSGEGGSWGAAGVGGE